VRCALPQAPDDHASRWIEAKAPNAAHRRRKGARIGRYVLKRVGLALITLWLLSVIVFAFGQVLPGDVARKILGPLADPRAVAVLNHKLGTDRSAFAQYWDWISHFVRGDMGTSYTYQDPIRPFIVDALVNSLKLALVAFVIVVPLSILGGVISALHVGRPLDRTITVAGLSGTVIPEFVSGIVLILVFGVWLGFLPTTASWPPGSGPLVQIEYLFLPAVALTLVLFGYIARMARAGTVAALDSDYTRTAFLNGMPRREVIRRHVLRNALLPTITVIASQLGYLIGGLVVIELLFNYHGIGLLIYNAANSRDFPMLEAGVLVVGVVYLLATLAADIAYSVLNPRIRLGGSE
jgi:peptide/nickel transport system permease protein